MHTQMQQQQAAAVTPDQVQVFIGNTMLGVPQWEPAYKSLKRLGLNPNTVTIAIDDDSGTVLMTDPNIPQVPFQVNAGRWHLTN